MNSLRIVLVMVEPPVPFGNASARWFYVLLKGLVERGHRVTAFATCSKPEEIEETKALFPSPAYDVRCYPHMTRRGLRAKWATLRQPYSYMFSANLRHDLAIELSLGFDILHLEQLWCGWLGLSHVERSVINIHYLFEIDWAEERPRTLSEKVRRYVTHRAEKRLIRQYPTITTFTPRLSRRAQEINPTAEVYTIPLGLELSFYPMHVQRESPHKPVVGLIGSFNWSPSYSAGMRLLTRLWPEIKRRVPNAQLQIVGREAKAAFLDFIHIPDIKIFENVPDSRPFFANTDVLLYAPITGSGIKVKVLEAFALGVPVITTEEGVEGIPAKNGIHAGIGGNDKELIDCTVMLLKHENQRQDMRIAARDLLELHCSPIHTLDAVEHMYTAIMEYSKN